MEKKEMILPLAPHSYLAFLRDICRTHFQYLYLTGWIYIRKTDTTFVKNLVEIFGLTSLRKIFGFSDVWVLNKCIGSS